MVNSIFQISLFLIFCSSFIYGKDFETFDFSIRSHQSQQQLNVLLKDLDQLVENPTPASFAEFASILNSLAEINPEIEKYFELKKTCFKPEGLKMLIKHLRKEQYPSLNTVVCISKEEFGHYLKKIQQSENDFFGSFIIKGNHLQEMIDPMPIEQMVDMQKSMFDQGMISEEDYNILVQSITIDFHMVPAFVHKTADSFEIYFTDSLGFAPSFLLKGICYFLGSLDNCSDIDIYVYPFLRQSSTSGCSIFSLLDCINFMKYPGYLSSIRNKATPTEEFWGDAGYRKYLSPEESIKYSQELQGVFEQVFQEYKQHLIDRGESIENLTCYDPLNEDMTKFMCFESKIYGSMKENLEMMIRDAVKPAVKNIHCYKINVLPPPLAQYSQSLTFLNKYRKDNTALVQEYEKLIEVSKGTYQKEISDHVVEIEGKQQNKMLEHVFVEYARIVLKEIL